MTIEELLECSASQLEAMSDAELLKHFQQYLNVTRPELAPKPQQRQLLMTTAVIPMTSSNIDKAELLKKLGVDVSHLFTTKQKRK